MREEQDVSVEIFDAAAADARDDMGRVGAGATPLRFDGRSGR
jgi:hypothetical protein